MHLRHEADFELSRDSKRISLMLLVIFLEIYSTGIYSLYQSNGRIIPAVYK